MRVHPGLHLFIHQAEPLPGRSTAIDRTGQAFYVIFGQHSEMLQQQPVDEDVSTADFVQEYAVGAVVEEAGVVIGWL
jgi:hypothetical protein